MSRRRTDQPVDSFFAETLLKGLLFRSGGRANNRKAPLLERASKGVLPNFPRGDQSFLPGTHPEFAGGQVDAYGLVPVVFNEHAASLSVGHGSGVRDC